MNKIKNNTVVKGIVILFLFGFCLGVLTFLLFRNDFGSYFTSFIDHVTNNHINTYILSVGIISIVFFLSITIIFMPLIPLYILYEGFSIGYTATIFLMLYGIKGLMFYSLYFILIKCVFEAIFLYFSYVSIKYSYKFIKSFIEKDRSKMYALFRQQFMRFILVSIFSIINSTFIFFFANKIINLFAGLIC